MSLCALHLHAQRSPLPLWKQSRIPLQEDVCDKTSPPLLKFITVDHIFWSNGLCLLVTFSRHSSAQKVTQIAAQSETDSFVQCRIVGK